MSANVDDNEIEKFDRLAEDWWSVDGPVRTLHAINPLRLAWIGQHARVAGARVLDVGCGGGILAEGLARAGARVVGIDLAERNVAIAQAHAGKQGLEIDYRRAGVDAVAAAEPDSYDIVTCLEVLEHVPEPASIVAACAHAVKPDGWVFFSTLNRTTKSFALAIVGAEYLLGLLPRGTHEYLKLVKPSELASAVRRAGLELRDLTGLHYNPVLRKYTLGGNVDVNYFACAAKPVRH
jgi:2-polyprenyl-6-hydroxyphenyl methylase/3-demethylubiquinone-9 3-methyltransferase